MEFTKLQSETKISKNIDYVDGKLVKSANAQVYAGRALQQNMTMQEFRDCLNGLQENECIVLGQSDFHDIPVTIKGKVNSNTTGISRSTDYFHWGQDSQLLCLDYDDSKLGNISPEDLVNIIDNYLPGFNQIRKVIKWSSGAWIYKDGVLVSKTNGFHIYFLVNHPEKIQEVFAGKDSILHQRLFIKYGWMKLTKPKEPELNAVRLLERTLYDNTVFSPERIIFECSPILGNELEKKYNDAWIIDGEEYLDLTKIKPLTKYECHEYKETVDREKSKAINSNDYKKCKKIFNSRVEFQIKLGIFKTKKEYRGLNSKEIVKREWKNSVSGVLNLESKIILSDKSDVTVRQILAEPEKYHLMDCFDPAEPNYSKSPIGMIYSNQDKPVIHSFAHGGMVFDLTPPEGTDPFEDPEYWLEHFFHDSHDRRNDYLHICGHTIEVMCKDGFTTKYAGYFNEDSESPMTSWWIKRKDKKTISGDGFSPGKPVIYQEHGKNMLNSYIPEVLKYDLEEPSPERAEELARPWADHIRDLIYNKEDAETILDFFAYLIQEPGERPMWSPLIISETKGVGKDTMVDIFGRCIGTQYVKRESIDNLCSGTYWGDPFYQSKLIVVSECGDTKNKYGVNESLKSAITDFTKNLNIKGKAVQNAYVYCGIIMFSNFYPYKIEDGERRIFATKCIWGRDDVKRREAEGYFKKLWAFYESVEALNGLYYWLMNRNIKANMKGVARETEVLRDIIESSVTEIDRFFIDIKKHPCKYWTTEQIYRLFENNVGEVYKHEKAIEYNIKKMKSTQETIKIEGKSLRLKTFDSDLAKESRVTIRNHIDQHWKKDRTIEHLYPDFVDSDLDKFVANEVNTLIMANNIIQNVETCFKSPVKKDSDKEVDFIFFCNEEKDYPEMKLTDEELQHFKNWLRQRKNKSRMLIGLGE